MVLKTDFADSTEVIRAGTVNDEAVGSFNAVANRVNLNTGSLFARKGISQFAFRNGWFKTAPITPDTVNGSVLCGSISFGANEVCAGSFVVCSSFKNYVQVVTSSLVNFYQSDHYTNVYVWSSVGSNTIRPTTLISSISCSTEDFSLTDKSSIITVGSVTSAQADAGFDVVVYYRITDTNASNGTAELWSENTFCLYNPRSI